MGRRRRDLTPEEKDLWARIARTTRSARNSHEPDQPPPTQARRETGLASAPSSPPDPPANPLRPFQIGGRVGGRDMQTRAPHDPAPSPAQRLAMSPLRMDPKTHKQMTRGKLRPEARLDLHGMTLADAHPALVGFLLSCRSRGYRLVLVITGKGRGDHGPLPTCPGALRHHVPVWLNQAPLSAAVQQVTAAHHRHGGEGAYYVYLRRPG